MTVTPSNAFRMGPLDISLSRHRITHPVYTLLTSRLSINVSLSLSLSLSLSGRHTHISTTVCSVGFPLPAWAQSVVGTDGGGGNPTSSSSNIVSNKLSPSVCAPPPPGAESPGKLFFPFFLWGLLGSRCTPKVTTWTFECRVWNSLPSASTNSWYCEGIRF